MAKRTFDTTLAWVEIDPNTLPAEQRAAYERYKAMYRQAREAREAFEANVQQGAPEGKVIKFGYNFGKLSMALDDAKADAKPKASKGSLADFLGAQQARGASH